jgi:glycosyltransferase involved in cell wall biosynthesis
MDMDYKTLETLAEKRKDYMEEYTGPIRIGFIGRIVPLKGVHLLVEAVKRIHTANIACELIIIGEGESAKDIQQRITENHAKSYIHLLGPKPSRDVRHDILPTLHIIVNPSFQEGLPTSVLE